MDVGSGPGVIAACYGAGALASLLLARWSGRLALVAAHLAALAGAVAGVWVSLGVLLAGPGRTIRQPLPSLFPFARLSLSIDGLSAWFLLVISLVSVAAAVYGPAYLRAHSPHAGSARQAAQGFALNVFLGCMVFACCAGDALTFLFCWEGMTLASYVLVVSDDRDGTDARAGLLYLVMAHGGTALLLVAFLALTERAGAFDFAALRAAGRDLDPAMRTTLFFLAFGGFAVKAGVVPLHVWLPRAHPAAPSHVSALMSGVMLKVAIYGILRFAFDLLAPPAGSLPFSWGWTVLLVGTTSAVLGVLYALQQHDLKRLLAFHSVENIGIILIGVGLAMILWRQEGVGGTLATVALSAALLHTVNHAAFKGLLFLGAGSVLCRTHVRQHRGAWRAGPTDAVDGRSVSARSHRDLGGPPAQRVRQRMAHLPGPPRGRPPLSRSRRPGDCLLRGHAGAHRRPRGRLFREGVRGDVPGASANPPMPSAPLRRRRR